MKILTQNKMRKIAILIPVIFAMFLTSCDYFFPPLSSEKIDVNEAFGFIKKHKNNPDVFLIDIRSGDEFDLIHIENFNSMDYSEVGFPSKIEELDKSKRYMIIGGKEWQTLNTMELMTELKFEKVHIIKGGIEEWQRQNLPLKY